MYFGNPMICNEVGVPEGIGLCFYCGNTIFSNERSYVLNRDITVCDCFDCKYDALKANIDELFWRFISEQELVNEAISWYFEEIV